MNILSHVGLDNDKSSPTVSEELKHCIKVPTSYEKDQFVRVEDNTQVDVDH